MMTADIARYDVQLLGLFFSAVGYWIWGQTINSTFISFMYALQNTDKCVFKYESDANLIFL
jgi:hypothetical protein